MAESFVQKPFHKISNSQKAALLLIILGQNCATQLMRHMSDDQMKKISFWINKVDYVPQELAEKVVKEFNEYLEQKIAKASLRSEGERPQTTSAIDKQIEKIKEVNEESERELLSILQHADTQQLAEFLEKENDQTIVWMLTHLDFKRIAYIFERLSPEKQIQVVNAIVTEDKEAFAIHQNIETLLKGRFSSYPQKGSERGILFMNEVLQFLDQESQNALISSLSTANPYLSQRLKESLLQKQDT